MIKSHHLSNRGRAWLLLIDILINDEKLIPSVIADPKDVVEIKNDLRSMRRVATEETIAVVMEPEWVKWKASGQTELEGDQTIANLMCFWMMHMSEAASFLAAKRRGGLH